MIVKEESHGCSDGEGCCAGHGAYARKDPRYFEGVRPDFVAMLPRSSESAILEVGCGTGATGQLALREHKCAKYCGIELLSSAARSAERVLSEVIQGDVESLAIPWSPGTFDAVIMSEVLEHLRDPWKVLNDVRRVMREGGMVYASSPNISHYRIILMLMRGRWDLTEAGPMDRTHLRWFTPHTYAELFTSCGFEVVSSYSLRPHSRKARIIRACLGGWGSWLFTRQIVIVARRAPTPVVGGPR
jgi:2-polyprenyl-3-methyl-5-hydroxy-6-metoxy-1,4-benzoquinol methylase